MLTILEISQRFDIGTKKLRRMEKAGILNCEAVPVPDETPVQKMIRYFGSRREFTTAHLVTMIEEPGLIKHLGAGEAAARAQLSNLGPPIEPAPCEVTAHVTFAAMNEEPSVLPLMEWVKSTIPKNGEVNHHYLAVRLLLGIPPVLRQYDAPRLSRAMHNIRKRQEFEGWWHVEEHGSRNVTLYQRPGPVFDL